MADCTCTHYADNHRSVDYTEANHGLEHCERTGCDCQQYQPDAQGGN